MADAKTITMQVSTQFIIVALHTKRAPSDAEWDEYIDHTKRALTAADGDASRIAGIAITDGGAPNAKQRAKLNLIILDQRIRGSVVTNSALVRGVVTALSWVNPNIRAFAPNKLAEAMQILGVPGDKVEEMWTSIQAAAREFGQPIQTMDAITAARGTVRAAS